MARAPARAAGGAGLHRDARGRANGSRPPASWPIHDTARLTEVFRRAALRLFVRLELFDEDHAAGLLAWPHSGFHVHTAVWVPEDNRAFATRRARYCARNHVALERLTCDRAARAVTFAPTSPRGPPPAPSPPTRWSFSRSMRRHSVPIDAGAPVPIVTPADLEVDALACPQCASTMRADGRKTPPAPHARQIRGLARRAESRHASTPRFKFLL